MAEQGYNPVVKVNSLNDYKRAIIAQYHNSICPPSTKAEKHQNEVLCREIKKFESEILTRG